MLYNHGIVYLANTASLPCLGSICMVISYDSKMMIETLVLWLLRFKSLCSTVGAKSPDLFLLLIVSTPGTSFMLRGTSFMLRGTKCPDMITFPPPFEEWIESTLSKYIAEKRAGLASQKESGVLIPKQRGLQAGAPGNICPLPCFRP